MLPNHSHNQSHPHLLILSQFVSRFPDQPNQTATQLPTWKCFQKSFAKVKKSSGDQNRTQKSGPKIDVHNGEPLFLGLQSWNSTHELVQNNHQLAPWTWSRCQIKKIHAPTTLRPSKAPSWTNHASRCDWQWWQWWSSKVTAVCHWNHKRLQKTWSYFSPFEFTESHPLFLRIDWHFERKFWGVTTSQSPVPNCFDSRGVLRQQDSGFFHAGHLPGQNNVKCEPTALEKTKAMRWKCTQEAAKQHVPHTRSLIQWPYRVLHNYNIWQCSTWSKWNHKEPPYSGFLRIKNDPRRVKGLTRITHQSRNLGIAHCKQLRLTFRTAEQSVVWCLMGRCSLAGKDVCMIWYKICHVCKITKNENYKTWNVHTSNPINGTNMLGYFLDQKEAAVSLFQIYKMKIPEHAAQRTWVIF